MRKDLAGLARNTITAAQLQSQTMNIPVEDPDTVFSNRNISQKKHCFESKHKLKKRNTTNYLLQKVK